MSANTLTTDGFQKTQIASRPVRLVRFFSTRLRLIEQLIFALGMLAYLATQLVLVGAPLLIRTVPVETDDAYTYILKAAEMESCFRQDCPALESLRPQLTAPANDPETAWLRYREYHRAFVVYHPLHSLILVALHQLGLTWETAFNAVTIAGSLVIGLGVAFWLFSLLGAAPAGLALLLLSATVFPNQGLHYVVPSNLALGIGLLAWAWVIHRDGRAAWAVVIAALALVTMHPLGWLYSLITVALFVLINLQNHTLSRKVWVSSAASLAIVGVSVLLPVIVARPLMGIEAEPLPPGWTTWLGLSNNLVRARDMIAPWIEQHGGIALLALWCLLGLFSLPAGARRSRFLLMLAILAGLLAASLVHILPHYPADSFSRVWIPFIILLTGLLGQAIWALLYAAGLWTSRLARRGLPRLSNRYRLLSLSGWTLLVLLVLVVALLQFGVTQADLAQQNIRATVSNLSKRQNVLLSSDQPGRLQSLGCAPVVYTGEIPMHFYFSRGGLDCPAIYFPGVADPPALAAQAAATIEAGYLVAWNPTVISGTVSGGTSLALAASDQVELAGIAEQSLPAIELLIENPGAGAVVDVAGMQGKTSPSLDNLAIPAGSFTWHRIAAGQGKTLKDLRLTVAQASRPLWLRGIRIDKSSPFYWPWDRGIAMTVIPEGRANKARRIGFESAALFPTTRYTIQVIDDQGDTVLARLAAP